MSVTTQDCTAVAARSSRSRRGLFTQISLAFAAWGQRRDLAGLDGHRLKDLGLHPNDVQAETARRIWDVPAGWRS